MLRPRSLLLTALALFPLSAIAQETRAVQTVQSIFTEDGVELVGYHYANPGAQPIVMVHGLGSNIFSLDLPMAQHSMARFLAARGYDIWVINLRGQGAGEIRSANPNDWNWSVDDYALRDVPAVIRFVRAETGQKPFVLGHSMGGMVLYAYLQGATLVTVPGLEGHRVVGSQRNARTRQADIKGFIAISAPPRLRWKYPPTLANALVRPPQDTGFLLNVIAKSDKVVELLNGRSHVPVAEIVDWLQSDLADFPYFGEDLSDAIFWLVSQLADNNWLALIANPDNVTPESLEVALRWAIDSASSKVLLQFMDGINHKTFREFHVADPGRKPYVYADHYDRIKVPALVMAGTEDMLACDDTVKQYGFMKLGSRDKTYLSFRTYGHGDILMGERANRSIYPKIVAWLRKHP